MKLRNVLLICMIVALVASCSSSRYFEYKIKMTHPEPKGQALNYENDTLSINFDINAKNFGIEIYNKTNEGLRFNWDEVSLALNGNAHRVVHKETGAGDIHRVQPPTTIPPRSRLTDNIIPRDRVQFLKSIWDGRTYTSLNDLFPRTDYGKKKVAKYVAYLLDNRLTLFLPFYMSGKYVNNYYDFIIEDITWTKGKKDKPQSIRNLIKK